jgi:hypothetical protein
MPDSPTLEVRVQSAGIRVWGSVLISGHENKTPFKKATLVWGVENESGVRQQFQIGIK